MFSPPRHLVRNGNKNLLPECTIEQEANEGGKTWSEIKRLANIKKGWRSSTDALSSIKSYRH